MDRLRGGILPASDPYALISHGLIVIAVVALGGCRPAVKPELPASSTVRPAQQADVEQFCGGCHRTPSPGDFARRDWRREVTQGYGLHAASGRVDLTPPPLEAVIAYYEQHAPEELTWTATLQVSDGDAPSPVAFSPSQIRSNIQNAAAITRIDRFDADQPLWLSDMRNSCVWTCTTLDQPAQKRWSIPHPAAICAVRREAGQHAGFVIADLGSFLPEDHQRGKLWWVIPDHEQPPVPLVEGLGRISHVTAQDLDGDGRDDLVVSEFGWRRTGRLQILWGEEGHADPPHFSAVPLDPRHGALRTEIRDCDGDGHFDIVAAFAQEHETVDIYRNLGDRRFERHTIYQAPDPAWGTSDFVSSDLDADGRVDLVVCHGDSFDGGELRPQHGVTWLRQTAPLSFEAIPLAGLPGAHRAVPADFDGDGDLDLAVVSLLPDRYSQADQVRRMASVVWLEQRSGLTFAPHVIEWDHCHHATCEVLDIDRDGDPDILAGEYRFQGTDAALLTVFRNEGAR